MEVVSLENPENWSGEFVVLGNLVEVHVEGMNVKASTKGRLGGLFLVKTCPQRDKCYFLTSVGKLYDLVTGVEKLGDFKVSIYEIPNKVSGFFEYWNTTFTHIQVAWRLEEGQVLHVALAGDKMGLFIGENGWKLRELVAHLSGVKLIKVHPAVRVVQRNESRIVDLDEGDAVLINTVVYWRAENGRCYKSIPVRNLIQPYRLCTGCPVIAGYVAPWVLGGLEEIPCDWNGEIRLWHY